MNRREFILESSLFLLSFILPGCKNTEAGQSPAPSQPPDTASCETTDDILGPYYRANAPLRNNIRVNGENAELLVISGTVYGRDCKTPLKGAQVEVWQANGRGEYDNNSSGFLYRAKMVTEESGKYELQTIMPGKYLNGRQYRPAHIHYRVTAPGYEELVTQIYFENDVEIPRDPWASEPEARARIIRLAASGAEKKGIFDIYL